MTDQLERVAFTHATIANSGGTDAVDGSIVGYVTEQDDELLVATVGNPDVIYVVKAGDVTEREPYEPAPGELPDA